MALFKYIVLSVCLCGIHLNGFAQSTREAILEDIAGREECTMLIL